MSHSTSVSMSPTAGVHQLNGMSGWQAIRYTSDPLRYNVADKLGITKDRVFGGGGGDSTPASSLRARIAREEWADYKARFQPLENTLLGYSRNPQQFINQQNQQALGGVNAAYAQAPNQITREANNYGISYDPQQQSEINRRLDLNKSLSQVQALNQSTRLARDQLLGIQGGGMFTGNKQLIGGLSTKPTEGN